MRILIYGAGVLGSVLAHLLMQGKHEVTMLARGKRAEQLEQGGLVIRHYVQRKTTVDRPVVVRGLERNDRYDLIFTVMKYSDIESILPALAANDSDNIVMIGNNPDAGATEQKLRELGGADKSLAFGFLVGGGIRREDGTVRSVQLGGGTLIAGALGGDNACLSLLREAFADSSCKLTGHTEIDVWLKNHMIPIVPLNAALHIHGGDVMQVARDKRLLRQVVDAMGEGFDLLEAAGYPLVPAAQARLIRRHKLALRLLLGLYHRLPVARLIDGSFAEIDALDRVFRRWASASGQASPAWDGLIEAARQAEAASSFKINNSLHEKFIIEKP